MNQEKAILHFNKFKNLRNSRVKDMVSGNLYIVQKARMDKVDEDEFIVWVTVSNEVSGAIQEFNSDYANSFFKEI
jgi:hypothetical protein